MFVVEETSIDSCKDGAKTSVISGINFASSTKSFVQAVEPPIIIFNSIIFVEENHFKEGKKERKKERKKPISLEQ